jgi:hypothetical protein
MKVIELLANTYKKIQAYTGSGVVTNAVFRKPTPTEMKKALITHEENLAWSRLTLLFDDPEVEVSLATLDPFINFLAQRWALMNDKALYEFSYFRRYNNPLTQVCVTLARELAVIEYDGKNYHYLELLMPTINIYNESMLMNLKELDEEAEEQSLHKIVKAFRRSKRLTQSVLMQAHRMEAFKKQAKIDAEPEKIQLHHFILDHWGNVINIKDCISNAMDGYLKHPSSLTTVIDETGRVPGFEFEEMDNRIENRIVKPEEGVIYIKVEVNSFTYFCKGMNEFEEITAAELNITTRPLSFGMLDPLQVEFMEILSARGHAQIQKQPRALLPLEKHRIIFHSKQANAYYNALLAIAEAKAKAYNARDAIKNLVDFLYEGGMRGHKGGTDEVSGFSSFIGIRNFYDFTQMLSEQDFTELMTMPLVSLSPYLHTVKDLWSELLATAISQPECDFSPDELKKIGEFLMQHFDAVTEAADNIRPENEKRKQLKQVLLAVERPILCAELFATKFKDLYKTNKTLGSIIPILYAGQHADGKAIREKLEGIKNYTCRDLNDAIRENHLSHYEAGNKLLTAEVTNTLFPLFPFSKFTQSLVTNLHELVHMLLGTVAEQHDIIIPRLLGITFLQKLLNTPEKIVTLCNTIANKQTLNLSHTTLLIFQTLGKKHLQTMEIDLAIRAKLKSTLPAAIYLDFFCFKNAGRKIDLGFLTITKPPLVGKVHHSKASRVSVLRRNWPR